MLLTNSPYNLRCNQKIGLIFVVLKGFQSYYKELSKCPFLDCPERYKAYYIETLESKSVKVNENISIGFNESFI